MMTWNSLVVEAQVVDNGANSTMEEAGQSAETSEHPLAAPMPNRDFIKSAVDQFHLNIFEAVMGDMSLCGDDDICLRKAKRIVESWMCAAAICREPSVGKRPVDCFDVADYSKEIRDQINALICPLIKTPSSEIRKTILHLVQIEDSTANEDEMVRYGAYLLALDSEGSAAACVNYIKDYVGEYNSSRWGPRWYSALSGCRILAQESTREEEEQDFSRWLGVLWGAGGSCLDIVNSELRKACSMGATLFSSDGQ